MAEQQSPWARPEPGSEMSEPARPAVPAAPGSGRRVAPGRTVTDSGLPGGWTAPRGAPQARPGSPVGWGGTGAAHRGGATPSAAQRGARSAADEIDLGPGWSRSGNVTLLGTPPPVPDVLSNGPDDDDELRHRRRLFRIFGGAAGAIAAVGIVVILALVMTGHSPLRNPLAHGPRDVLPPLAKACPPPSADAQDLPPAPPAPPGPRTVDTDAGISYAAQGPPWTPWSDSWSAGDLHVRYGVGQHFVTETYTDDFGAVNQYHASILSGSVPAAANDALTLDLKCTGHQVLADVRQSYYPQPNTIETMRDEVTVLGGRPAWVAKFRLHFHQSGLKATSELVGLALINVGRPNAAVLYISIPGTHSQFDPVVDSVLASVRPT